MRSTRSCLVTCLLNASIIVGLSIAPNLSFCAAPAPAAGALSPVAGARQALERAYQAKGLPEFNGCLTNESAATIGFSLIMMDSLVSGLTRGMADALTPKTAPRQNAQEKAYQDKAVALLDRYSLNKQSIDDSNKSGTLPPGLVAHGHQFLADALALSNAYEKSHSGDGVTRIFQSGKNVFPAPGACDFQVLSPTRVKIVPRGGHRNPLEAHLEDGQWRIDMGGVASSSPSAMKIKTITPEASAFLKDIEAEDLTAIEQKLKATPSLANSPPAFYHGDSGSVSQTPLSMAAFGNSLKVAALLIRYGANVNAEDDFSETSLDRAARFGSKGVTALLLAHGANIGHKNGLGQTALHMAVMSDDPATVALLLAHGADINARDQDGTTPLSLALSSHGDHSADHAAIVKLLRHHGARM